MQYTNKIKNLFTLILAISGNMFVASLFAQSFWNPEAYPDFIQNKSYLIFVVEFVSIYAAISLFNKPGNSAKLFNPLFLFVVATVVSYGFIYKNWVLPTIFVVSTIAKYFESTSFKLEKREAGTNLLVWILTVVIVSVYTLIFRDDSAIQYTQRTKTFFWGFTDGVLVWGMLYYSILAMIEVFNIKQIIREN